MIYFTTILVQCVYPVLFGEERHVEDAMRDAIFFA